MVLNYIINRHNSLETLIRCYDMLLINTAIYNVHACQDTILKFLVINSFLDLGYTSNRNKVDFCWCFVIIALMTSFIIIVFDVFSGYCFHLRNSLRIHQI